MTLRTALMSLVLLIAGSASAQERRPKPTLVPDVRGVPVEGLDEVLDDLGYPRERTALLLMTMRNGRIETERPTLRLRDQQDAVFTYRNGTDYDCLLAAMPNITPGTLTIATAGNCRPGSPKLYRKRGREYAALGTALGITGVGFTALGVAGASASNGFMGFEGTLSAISLGVGIAGLAEGGMMFGFSSGMFRTAKRIDEGTF